MTSFFATSIAGVALYRKPLGPIINPKRYVDNHPPRHDFDLDSDSESESESDRDYEPSSRGGSPAVEERLPPPVDVVAQLTAHLIACEITPGELTVNHLTALMNDLGMEGTEEEKKATLAAALTQVINRFGGIHISDDESTSAPASSSGSTSSPLSTSSDHSERVVFAAAPYTPPSPPRFIVPTPYESRLAFIAFHEANPPPVRAVTPDETERSLAAAVATVTPLDYANAPAPDANRKERRRQAVLSRRAKRAAAPAPVVKVDSASGEAVGRRSQHILKEAAKGGKAVQYMVVEGGHVFHRLDDAMEEDVEEETEEEKRQRHQDLPHRGIIPWRSYCKGRAFDSCGGPIRSGKSRPQ